MSNILLTCGRGTFSLALARSFRAAGHRVFVADSWPRCLCRYSATVDRCFHVPAPAQQTQEWVRALVDIAADCEIDLIVPVYEEIFYLAQAAESFSPNTRLFAADFDTLIGLHSKWLFNQTTRSLGLTAPETQLLTTRYELLSTYSNRGGKELVFKPVYSRFAALTLVRPQSESKFDGIEPTSQRPWVAQQFLPGRPVATYSVAQHGRVTAHSAYAAEFTFGFGPTVAYRPIEQPAAFEWVSKLIEHVGFTGQMGVDFIENADGGVSAIECNPRLTGGMYLLKDDPSFAAAFTESDFTRVITPSNRAYVFRLPAFFTLLKHSEHFPGFKDWAKVIFLGRSTNEFSWSDPLPNVMKPLLDYLFVHRCFMERKTGPELIVEDFEWSDEPTQDVAPIRETAGVSAHLPA